MAIVLFTSVVYCVSWEKSGFATLITAAALVLLFRPGVLWTWAVAHPLGLLVLFGLYFVAGTFWTVVKWFLFLRKNLVLYQEEKEQLLSRVGASSLDGVSVDKINELLSTSYEHDYVVNPKVSSYKAKILAWMLWWPFSVIGTLLNDFVRNIFNHIFNFIKGYLQAMSDKVFNAEIVAAELAKKNKTK